jgi:glycosyltransferase involved in cell wall biosynthesis
MKIAHVIPIHLMKMGGLQIFVHNIAQHQVAQGHDVYVITNAYPKKLTDYSYSIIRVPALKGTRFLYKIYKYLTHKYFLKLQNKHKFDVWQVNGGYPYGTLLADFFLNNHIPSVLRCSGDDIQVSDELEYGVRRNEAINRLVEKNYYKFTKVIAITKTVEQEYKKLNIHSNKIELIPNGVDYERISDLTITFDVRKRHNIPSTAKIILSVGRHHPKKNYLIIPGIVKYLLENGTDVYWIVIGDGVKSISHEITGDDLNKHLILIDELSSDNNNKIKFPNDELLSYYKQSDIFAMTSMLETFGIVIIEAMAAGLPIICFNVSGIVDVMSERCGYICPAGDVEMYKMKLFKMLRSDNIEFSKESVKMSANYSWERVSKMYLNVYSNIIRA